jgi:20S proteasome alpha/beta subunit
MFAQPTDDPHKNTLRPMVTGTSAIGIKYKGGVMVATDSIGKRRAPAPLARPRAAARRGAARLAAPRDCRDRARALRTSTRPTDARRVSTARGCGILCTACYGNWIRYKDVQRIHEVSKDTLIAMSGELSDYQKILQILEQKRIAEYCVDDGSTQTSAELHSFITRTMYQKRCKFDPLWNMLLVAGFRDGEGYLGYSDLYGSHFADNYMATGLGMYMALPLMRNAWNPELSEAEARKLLETSLKICYYRDTRASNKVCARHAERRARARPGERRDDRRLRAAVQMACDGSPCQHTCAKACVHALLAMADMLRHAARRRARPRRAGPDRTRRRDRCAHRRAHRLAGRVEPPALPGGQRKGGRRRMVSTLAGGVSAIGPERPRRALPAELDVADQTRTQATPPECVLMLCTDGKHVAPRPRRVSR